MIISRRLKFIFFRTPKTGSTTASVLLRKHVVKAGDLTSPMKEYGDPGDVWLETMNHGTPTHAVDRGLITEAELSEFYCVAGLREPKERYMSAFAHQHSVGMYTLGDDIVDLGIMDHQQKNWFTYKGETVCEPIWFDNFDYEFNQVLIKLGEQPILDIPKLNANEIEKVPAIEDHFKPTIAQGILSSLTDDIVFYDSMKGQRS